MAKNSEDYWRKREEEQRKHNIKDEQEFRKELEKMYRTTLKEVNDQIYAFYAKYASQNAITMAEAKRRADKLDIEAYAEKARRYVKEKNFSEQANKEMRIYNLTMKANRLELLKAEIGLELCANADEVDDFMREELEGRTLNEIERQAGILGKSIQDNRKFAQALVNASFHNATFSDRIWANQALLRNELSNILTTALIQGRNPRDFISRVRKRFDVSTNNAYRLLVTELARVQTSAQMESFKRNGFDQYTFLALGTACEICRKIDGKHFDVEKANAGVNMPPMHPNCRCSTSAYMDDDEYNAWLDSYKDHGLTWDEWKNQNRDKSKGTLKESVKRGKDVVLNDRRYSELSKKWKENFGIEIDESVKKLNYQSVNKALDSLEKMITEYPGISEYVKRISTSSKGAMVFRASKNDICLNPAYFSNSKSYDNLIKRQVQLGYWMNGTSIESDMVHESAHVLEFMLLNKNNDYKTTLQKENAWNECYEAEKIVIEAFNNLKLSGTIKGERLNDLISGISRYATESYSETLAEAFSDCYLNGSKANEISKEIKRLVDAALRR